MTVAPRSFGCCSAHLWPIARPHISGRGSIPSICDVCLLRRRARQFRRFYAQGLRSVELNWNEQWAQHREAADQWAQVVENFRSLRSEDGSWPETHRSHLNSAYWQAAREVVVIPERRFNRLKRRYLRKVALSELNSAYPGCPIPLLLAVLTFRDAAGALRKHKSNSSESSRPPLCSLGAALTHTLIGGVLRARYLGVNQALFVTAPSGAGTRGKCGTKGLR